MSDLNTDHYFWCSGGVPGCFEGVSKVSGRLTGCSGLFQEYSGDVPGFTDTHLPRKGCVIDHLAQHNIF